MHKTFSNFLTLPLHNHRYFSTYTITLHAITLLAGVYWWETKNFLLCIIPLTITLINTHRFIYIFVYFFMVSYCMFLEYYYIKIQSDLLGHHTTLKVYIQDIHYNQVKNNYKITGLVKLTEYEKKAYVQVFSKDKPFFKNGDFVAFKNITFKKPTQVSYQKYLLKENIHGITYCSSLPAEIIGHKKNLFTSITEKIKQLEQELSTKLSPMSATLFSSLFLGSKKYGETSNTTIKDLFNAWGINHFLARSGLHVTLILFLLFFMGKLCGLPSSFLNIITCFFMIFYGLFSYISTSFVRAFIMALLTLWCIIARVPVNALHLLTITLLIILFYNPFLALFLDFQLTFLLTWGLCILTLLDF